MHRSIIFPLFYHIGVKHRQLQLVQVLEFSKFGSKLRPTPQNLRSRIMAILESLVPDIVVHSSIGKSTLVLRLHKPIQLFEAGEVIVGLEFIHIGRFRLGEVMVLRSEEQVLLKAGTVVLYGFGLGSAALLHSVVFVLDFSLYFDTQGYPRPTGIKQWQFESGRS